MSDNTEILADLLDAELSGLMSNAAQPDWFDEELYLRLNPDIVAAIAQGRVADAYTHYRNQGWRENRRLFEAGQEPYGRLIRSGIAKTADGLDPVPQGAKGNLESATLSPTGALAIIGWLDDRNAPVKSVLLRGDGWVYAVDFANAARFRRRDVEGAVGSGPTHSFGFVLFAHIGEEVVVQRTISVQFRNAIGGETTYEVDCRSTTDADVRNLVMGYIAQSEYLGNHQLEAIRTLDNGLGAKLVAHNLSISRQMIAGVYVQSFGTRNRKLAGSIVVCLYGRSEYLFLQQALFSGRPGYEDYEFIYVSNSPELNEVLLAEARLATLIYGIPITLVLLPGNAGFGAANNIAARYANSDRIVIMNPDVMPYHADWARRHTDAILQLPDNESRIFGTTLYYDDGSLMHGGMYFEMDNHVSISKGVVIPRKLSRVEHYGKGAPQGATHYTRARPVPAVTGAFISVQRDWFEHLGGFTEDYIFGHYEDADLCMKSLGAGVPAWLHDIKLWHLEGKGSTRLPVHEGGSIVNRWLFTDRWGPLIMDSLLGPDPTHPLLSQGRS